MWVIRQAGQGGKPLPSLRADLNPAHKSQSGSARARGEAEESEDLPASEPLPLVLSPETTRKQPRGGYRDGSSEGNRKERGLYF